MTDYTPPYSEAEKQWLKLYCSGEYRFLRSRGLSIHCEEERAEGRRIFRDEVYPFPPESTRGVRNLHD